MKKTIQTKIQDSKKIAAAAERLRKLQADLGQALKRQKYWNEVEQRFDKLSAYWNELNARGIKFRGYKLVRIKH